MNATRNTLLRTRMDHTHPATVSAAATRPSTASQRTSVARTSCASSLVDHQVGTVDMSGASTGASTVAASDPAAPNAANSRAGGPPIRPVKRSPTTSTAIS